MEHQCRWFFLLVTLYFPFLSAERAYPLGCSTKESSFYDYEKSAFPPRKVPNRSTDDYMISRRLGAGKFSDVFEAVDVQLENQLQASHPKELAADIDPRTLVVLKCLKPVAQRKIKRELLVLQHASQLPNLVRLLAVVVPDDYSDPSRLHRLHSMPTFVLEHAGIESQWCCHGKDQECLTEEEIQFFLYHLLFALDQLHSIGIMHRDVKPRNVLIDRMDKKLVLIDLGLADFYLPNQRYNVRVASRHYKAPELLLGYELYDYSIDMWGVGCMLAGLLLRREPFFRGKDNLDQLGTIVSVLGTKDLNAFMSKAKLKMTGEMQEVIKKHTPKGKGHRRDWNSWGTPQAKPSVEGLDLLSKLLVYDHNNRLTSKQAMAHPFFDSVRAKVERQLQKS